MTRTDQLDSLFQEWEGNNRDYANNFSKDGIVDEERFNAASRRLLFILKEPMEHSEDLCKHAKNFAITTNRSNATWRNLNYWSYGLLRNFPSFAHVCDANDLPKVLYEVAVMNVKKTRGRSAAEDKKIVDFARDGSNRNFIQKEIEIIAPSIIVCCGSSVTQSIRLALSPEAPSLRTKNDLEYFRWNDCLVVAYCHPAARVWNAMLYSYLIGECQPLLQPS